MRTAAIIAVLSAATVYATPVAQNGRWQPEWESQTNEATSIAATLTASATAMSAVSSATVVPVASSSILPPPPPASSSAVPAPLGNPNAAPNPPPNPALVASLLNAASASSRIQTLSEAVGNGTADFKFDFNPAANPGTPGLGGEVILANRANFPPLVGLGVAFAALFFEPCGLNTPHIHPRATEVLTLVTEGTLTGGFVFDNTFNMEVSENLTQFQGMAFPQGSIHWQLNNECYPLVAIAGFSDEDPGASSIAQNFFVNTRDDVTLAALGFPAQITAENFNDLQANIPRAFALGIQNCYAKCGITPPPAKKA